MFASPSIKKTDLLEKSNQKTLGTSQSCNQVCQLCNESTNIPWVGCNYEVANGIFSVPADVQTQFKSYTTVTIK